jgi:hypothetical protein
MVWLAKYNLGFYLMVLFVFSEIMSSSSLSSSESDAGLYTNDEGREGEREHILTHWFVSSCDVEALKFGINLMSSLWDFGQDQ